MTPDYILCCDLAHLSTQPPRRHQALGEGFPKFTGGRAKQLNFVCFITPDSEAEIKCRNGCTVVVCPSPSHRENSAVYKGYDAGFEHLGFSNRSPHPMQGFRLQIIKNSHVRTVPEISLGGALFFSDPSIPRTHMESEPPDPQDT